MEQIGFIGLGHMGNPMAHRLLQAGYVLKVYDIVPANMQALVDHGALSTLSVAECVKDSDIVITMLQTGQQVSSVCLTDQGIFANAKNNALYIDCSSIDIAITRQLHQQAQSENITMLDAPVSGGVMGAQAGTLTFMVGGEENAFLKAKPTLEKMGKKIVHAGAEGLGQAAKICNNLILGISMVAVSEGFLLADKLGLEAKKFFEIASNASAQCWSMSHYCPVPGVIENAPSNNDYQPGFTASMMLKDLLLGMSAAKAAHASIPLGHATADLYSMFVNKGNAELDFSAIITMLKNSDIHSYKL
jgi:3-hydroxyisobutyrate dehydrogenase